MPTIATLFSGGEGVGVGARAAGLRHLWGIEYDDDVAQAARDNGFDVVTADVTTARPCEFPIPDVLHASPPCPNFSTAKTGAKETGHDIALARATALFLDSLRPRIFTLENVYLYRKSESWHIIADTLNRCGYWYDLAHVNAADMGVPQTRKRMWVRALRGRMVPHLPPPEPWVGWYEAIEDLIPALPESGFADWQLARLPEDLQTFMMNGGGNTNLAEAYAGRGCRSPDEPIHTITDVPANTVTAHNRGDWRAFLIGDQAANAGDGVQTADHDQPAMTVTTRDNGGSQPRAWLSQGCVVTMTPRALARFQSFPDSYRLPEVRKIACAIIGNAVPPLQYQKLIAPLIEAIR